MQPLEGRTLFSSGTAALVGYLPDYESNSSLLTTLNNAAFEGLTQVNYFSVVPTTSGLLPGTTVNGNSNTSTKTTGGYALTGPGAQLSTIVTDAHAAGVKVDVVVGGSGSQSNFLTSVVEGGSATWRTFAASVSQFATAHGIDGIDLDWEPQELNSYDPADYGNLISTIHQVNPALNMSAAVASCKLPIYGGGSTYVLNSTGVQNLTSINVMAYDLQPGNVSPIGLAESNFAGWGSYVQSLGMSKQKLIFAMPFYGTSGSTWATTVAEQYGQLVIDNGSLPSPSSDSVVLKGTTWNYNGPDTINSKTAYSLDNGYGGVAAWEVGQDYFTAYRTYDSTYSLLPQFAKAESANTGTITGTVATGTGSAVAGETVYVDSNNNGMLDSGELTTTTNSAGKYSFADLLVGNYEIRQVLPSGYTQTSPAGGTGQSVSAGVGTTAPANFTVAPTLTATAVTLKASGSTTSNATQSLGFTATVTGGVPNGQTVKLEDASNGNTVVASAQLAGGVATFTITAGTLLGGKHNLFAVYSGDVNFAASQSTTITQTVQIAVTGEIVNGNIADLAGAQRSMVDSIVYSFSEAVTLDSSAFGIAIHSGQTGTLPTLVTTALNPAGNGSSTQWVMSFSGSGVVGKSIANGVYDITVLAGGASNLAGVSNAAASTYTFGRLFGDINGDGTVNGYDSRLFSRDFLSNAGSATYNAAFDYNDDGTLNGIDSRFLSRDYLVTYEY